MSDHKDDEEVFSETCQSSGVFLQSGNNSPCHTTLTCFAQQIVEGWTRGTRQDTTSKFREVENACFSETNATSEKQKKLLKFMVKDSFLENICGSSDPNFPQSADCHKFGSLEPFSMLHQKISIF